MEVYQDWSEYPDRGRGISGKIYVYYCFLPSCYMLNGSREENVHCSLWNENNQSCCQRVKVLF